MSGPISAYYASVGIQVDDKALRQVDKYLSAVENKLKKGFAGSPIKIPLDVDANKFRNNIQNGLNTATKSNPIRLNNILLTPSKLTKSAQDVLNKTQFRVPITATLSRASIQAIRAQLQGALFGVPVGVRISGASGRTGGRGNLSGDGSESARRRASITGRGDPSVAEFLGGTYSKSSLTAGNRRYADAIMEKGLAGFGAKNGILRGVAGGIGRMGASTMVGRGLMMGGTMLGGPVGGAIGGVLASVPAVLMGYSKALFSTLTTMVTAPFKILGGVVDGVTSTIYRMGQVLLPWVAGGMYINNMLGEQQSRTIALNTVAKSQGSTGDTERKWLMNVANRDGMRFDNIIDPYTSFIASASPAMGLDRAKGVFEAFTQFGASRGADSESSKRAFTAVAQMAGKGKVGA